MTEWKPKKGQPVWDCDGVAFTVLGGPYPLEEDVPAYVVSNGDGESFLKPLVILFPERPKGVEKGQSWVHKRDPDKTLQILSEPFQERDHDVWVCEQTTGGLLLLGERHIRDNYRRANA